MHYYYDEFNRLSRLDNGNYYTYHYTYDKKGNLISLLDEFCNIITTYGYDSIGRLVSSNRSNGFGMYQTYDAFNRINKLVYTKGADTEVYRYIYNDKNLIGSVVLPTGKSISNSYDSLNRLVLKQISDAAGLSVSYTYKAGINGTTSSLIETVTTAEGVFSYTYDANGNIQTVSKNGVLQESYTYDELGQLKTVTRGTNVYEYTYDNGGNILNVKLNGTVTDTYTYGDANWKDLLTAFNGQTITYDAIGNPLQYRDGMYFEWVRGRTLGSIVKDNGNTCINFVVNHDGIRINKNVMRIESGITDYNFEYNGNLLVRQSWNNNVMWFLYDESGNPVGFTLNDTEYYYLKNLQGDITAITDANGNVVAKYTYDEWGKILSITDANGADVSANENHIANINPLRYRGYYYDSETGFYYLLTRYYDPVTRRVINPDTTDVLTASMGALTDKNLFAYCDNNPIMRADVGGQFWDTVFDVVSLVCSVVEVVKNPKDASAWTGLVLDVVDVAVPCVGGLGETYDAINATRKIAKKADDAIDSAKVVSKSTKSARSSAVRKAWKNEYNAVKNTGIGSRDWTPWEKEELLRTGKVSGYVGHHMKSVKGYPELAGDPNNIQFLTRKNHFLAHEMNWRNITHGRYIE